MDSAATSPADQGVDDGQCPLKTGHTCLSVPVCTIDAATPQPATVGKAVVDDHVHTADICTVCCCGSVRCKTCRHMHVGSTLVTLRRNNTVQSVQTLSWTDYECCNRCGVRVSCCGSGLRTIGID